MTKHLEAVVQFQLGSGLPTDRTVNTFHFNTIDAYDTGTLDDITNAILGFYEDAHGSDTMYGFFAQAVKQNGHRLTIYDWDIAPPIKTPVHDISFNLPAEPTTGGLPSEVALVLSFHADLGGVGAEGARRRKGRIYFGPIKNTAASQTDSGSIPGTGIIDCANAAMEAFNAEVAGITDTTDWVVWSTVDNAGRAVVGGWVDNAWDTQRRRGFAPSNRFVWP